MKKILLIISFCIFCLVLFACSNSPQPTPTSEPVVLISPTIEKLTESPTNSPTALPSPTMTSTPSPTSSPTVSPTPTETSTPTPPPLLEALIISRFANVRTGPGEVYPILVTFTEGIKLEILGRNTDSSWVFVAFTLGQVGWISEQSIDTEVTITDLSEIEAPPTPTPVPLFPKAIAYISSGGNLVIEVDNFQPEEPILISLISAESGNTLATRKTKVDINGAYSTRIERIVYNLQNSWHSGSGSYIITVQGEFGSSAQVQINIDF